MQVLEKESFHDEGLDINKLNWKDGSGQVLEPDDRIEKIISIDNSYCLYVNH